MPLRRELSHAFGATLVAVGLGGSYYSLLMAEETPVGILGGACFYAAVGGYWLWADLATPFASQKSAKRKAPPKRGL